MEFREDQRDIWDLMGDLRYGYSNEIPNQEIHSSHRNEAGEIDDKYKVRRAWFYGVTGTAQMAVSMGYVTDPRLKKEVEGFVKKYTSPKFQKQALTKPEDIKAGDNILDKILRSRR